MAGVPGVAVADDEDPTAQVAAALRGLGPPGMVWGRLAVEEESPVGGWTPLDGVEVTLYPATPALLGELDQIRRGARASGAQYDSAVARVQAALATHQRRVESQSAPSPAMAPGALVAEPQQGEVHAAGPTPSPTPDALRSRGGPEPPGGAATPSVAPGERAQTKRSWLQKTDPAGLFVFEAVPSGDWLVVAVRVGPYGAEKLRGQPAPRQAARSQRFLPRAAPPAKEAELWMTRVRVVAGERVGLQLTDRARWLVGPLR
jgi:hypothetical protein